MGYCFTKEYKRNAAKDYRKRNRNKVNAQTRFYRKKRALNDPIWKKLRAAANVRYRHKRNKLIEYFKNKPCADCQGWFAPYQMQFDHRNPAEKKFTIGDRVERKLKDLLQEIKKCDVVCANCHAERTHKLILGRSNHHKSFAQQ